MAARFKWYYTRNFRHTDSFLGQSNTQDNVAMRNDRFSISHLFTHHFSNVIALWKVIVDIRWVSYRHDIFWFLFKMFILCLLHKLFINQFSFFLSLSFSTSIFQLIDAINIQSSFSRLTVHKSYAWTIFNRPSSTSNHNFDRLIHNTNGNIVRFYCLLYSRPNLLRR